MPGPVQQKYEITTSDGAKYEVMAKDDAQAKAMADFAEAQHAAGNTDPTKWTNIPDGGLVESEPGKTSSVAGTAVRQGTEGFTFNLGDEIASGINAVVPGLASLDNADGASGGGQRSAWSKSSSLGNPRVLSAFAVDPIGSIWAAVHNKGVYDAYTDNMRDFAQQRAADYAQHPRVAPISNVVGSMVGVGKLAKAGAALAGRVAPGIALPLALRYEAAAMAAPVRTAAATAAGLGGTAGAVSGFGAGDTMANRKQSAALGFLTGGALGAGIGASVAGLGPAVARYARVLMGRGTQEEATAQIVKALARDGYDVTSPSGVQAIRTELGRYTGKPVSIADIGAATRARAGVGLRSPSAVQQQSIDTITSRAQGTAPRLAADIRATVAPRTDVHALDQALIDQRATAALPLRDQALFEQGVPALPPPRQGSVIPQPDGTFLPTTIPTAEASEMGRKSIVVNDPTLQQLARLPDAQKALQGAVQRAEAERSLKSVLGQPIDDIPDINPGSDLDMRTFDYLKRFLDDEVNSLYKKGDTQTFKAGQAKQVQSLRDAIRDRLKMVQPDGTVGDQPGPYGDYLNAYKGSSEMIDSLAAGRDFNKLDPEQIAAEQAGRSTAGQELYRVGTARNLLDTISSTRDRANPANRILNSDEARAQLAATGVEPASMQRLTNAVQQERTLGLLPQELQGSQTDARRLASQDAEGHSGPIVPFNPGSPYGWAGAAIRGVLNHTSTARNSAVNEALLPRMLATDPAAVNTIIDSLEAQGKKAIADALRRQLKSRSTARSVGAIIGSPVSIQEEQN